MGEFNYLARNCACVCSNKDVVVGLFDHVGGVGVRMEVGKVDGKVKVLCWQAFTLNGHEKILQTLKEPVYGRDAGRRLTAHEVSKLADVTMWQRVVVKKESLQNKPRPSAELSVICDLKSVNVFNNRNGDPYELISSCAGDHRKSYTVALYGSVTWHQLLPVLASGQQRTIEGLRRWWGSPKLERMDHVN